jgi:hypothetical protein
MRRKIVIKVRVPPQIDETASLIPSELSPVSSPFITTSGTAVPGVSGSSGIPFSVTQAAATELPQSTSREQPQAIASETVTEPEPQTTSKANNSSRSAAGDTDAEDNSPVLSFVNPFRGPTSGGDQIVLLVSNLPPTINLYARFGPHITSTASLPYY